MVTIKIKRIVIFILLIIFLLTFSDTNYRKKKWKKKIKNIDVTVNSSILYNDITSIIETKLVILC